LKAFCRTIGKAKTLRLTKITEHAPFEGAYLTNFDRPAGISKGCMRRLQSYLAKKGYHERGTDGEDLMVEQALTGAEGHLRD